MASDCTVAIDNGYITLRVGAIIMKDKKFIPLMAANLWDKSQESRFYIPLLTIFTWKIVTFSPQSNGSEAFK